MRLNSWFRVAVIAGAAVSLTACSYIASLFPDKQKQYRYSSELPDLEIPPDLIGSKVGNSRDEIPDIPVADSGKGKPAVDANGQPQAVKRAPVKHSSNPTLAQNVEDAALIELHEPYAEAWNDVSRALGRMKVEITDQNRSDGMFYVYYGGETPQKPEETSLFDDIKTMFGFNDDKAQEYRIKLEAKDAFTFIHVFDTDGKAVSGGPGFELLKRLHKKLTTLDQPEPEGEEGRRAAEAEKKATENPSSEPKK
jgi:uncharacterized lipoprotein